MNDNLQDMNDDLQSMIGEDFNEVENTVNEESIELNQNEEEKKDLPDIDPPSKRVGLVPLSTWFVGNRKYLQQKSVGYLAFNVKGFDSSESLLFTVPHPDGGETEEKIPRTKLRFFDNSNKILVPNLEAEDFCSLNSGFVVTQKYDEEVILKSYIFKTGLVMTSCYRIDDLDIPYSSVKIMKKDTEAEIFYCDRSVITNKLDTRVDKQMLQLLYKQIEKSIDEVNTVRETLIWLLNKQKEINDLHHLVQIDNTIIDIMK